MGKMTKRHFVLKLAGVGALCAAMLALGLFFGLSDSGEGGGDSRINAQATGETREQMDHNSMGCYMDSASARTMTFEFKDTENMTPDVSASQSSVAVCRC